MSRGTPEGPEQRGGAASGLWRGAARLEGSAGHPGRTGMAFKKAGAKRRPPFFMIDCYDAFSLNYIRLVRLRQTECCVASIKGVTAWKPYKP